jgi:hypothetical protein
MSRQTDQIMAYLEPFGSFLSPGSALKELGIYALSQRCGQINKDARVAGRPEPIESYWATDGVSRYKCYRRVRAKGS